MTEYFDVVIIGAGTAGLSAVKEVKKQTDKFLLVDRGPLGTTCSRVGCMPSKVLLQFAHDHARAVALGKQGFVSAVGSLNTPALMTHVRAMRDHFVEFILNDISELGERFHLGEARFIGPNHLLVGAHREIKAKSIILATGGSPNLPKPWAELGDLVVTTDQFFELEDLPQTWGVIGLGAIGLELGLALARLGKTVFAYHQEDCLGNLQDPVVAKAALGAFGQEMTIKLGVEAKLKRQGSRVLIHDGQSEQLVDKVLIAIGRKPNLSGLDLEKSLCRLDEKGMPLFAKDTMKVESSDDRVSLYIAGDLDGDRALLHEAADEGRIAGYNAVRSEDLAFKRRVPVAVAFSSPDLAVIGERYDSRADVVIGEVSFDDQGRSKIMQENAGSLRLYVDKASGRLLGAELAAPSGEHLAHIIASAIAEGLSVQDMLKHPFYHPTVEEGLRTALRKAATQIKQDERPLLELDPA